MVKCLIVDDSSTVRRIARKILEKLDFECMEAENGEDAYRNCCEQMPDIILLDWNMPVMTGIEFLEKLRSMENGDIPKVLFCTTETSIDFIERGMSTGANEYIMKPFDSSILSAKLATLGYLEDCIS